MICKKCRKKFAKQGNRAIKTNGDTVTVCPDCGNEEIEKIKEKINSYSVEEFDKVLFECGIEDIKPSIESDYVQAVKGNQSEI